MTLAIFEGLISPTHLLILAFIGVILWFRLARQSDSRDRD